MSKSGKAKKPKSTLSTQSIVEIEHSAEAWALSAERIPIFTINTLDHESGETVSRVYDMPARPNQGMGLAFLAQVRRQGAEVATSWLIEAAVGAEGYDALAAEPDVDEAALTAIITKIRTVAMGGLKSPKA